MKWSLCQVESRKLGLEGGVSTILLGSHESETHGTFANLSFSDIQINRGDLEFQIVVFECDL